MKRRRLRIDDRVMLRSKYGKLGTIWELRASGRVSVRWDGHEKRLSYNLTHYSEKSLMKL